MSSRPVSQQPSRKNPVIGLIEQTSSRSPSTLRAVSYTHLRAHETEDADQGEKDVDDDHGSQTQARSTAKRLRSASEQWPRAPS